MWERCDEARFPTGQDPDFVGTGTLIAYAGSASVAVVCLVIQYLFFHVSQDEELSWTNPVDVLLLGEFRKVLGCLGIRFGWLSTPQSEHRWQATFDRCIMTIGDTQLAMGFAVLAFGYVSLMDSLSVYHWWLIIGLAWFSVVTNLAATSYLRTYFTKHPSERQWRVFLLICLTAMLGFSMVPIVRVKEAPFAHEPEEMRRILATNVLCYLPGHGPRYNINAKSPVVLLAIALVAAVALFGILWLYERPNSIIFKWRDRYRGEMQQSFFGDMITCIRCEQRYMLLVVRPVLAFWLVLRMYADLMNSVLTEVLCVTAMFAWVTMRFIETLFLGSFEPDHWSLGQIVALAFFVAPVGLLATCVCSTLLLGLINQLRRLKLPTFKWPRFSRRTQSKSPEVQANESGQPASVHPEADRSGTKGSDATESNVVRERNDSTKDEDGFMSTYTGTYKVLPAPWFAIALPIAGFSSLLHVVLLLVLPKVPRYLSTANVLWETIFWYIVYQPLLVFVFLLAGMVVEERVTQKGRMRAAYSILAVIAVGLSTAAIFDTLYGLGGIPMSYIGMGAVGLGILIYVLYGCVAHPGPLAKGKGRTYIRDGDVEEAAPLLGPRKTSLPEYRIVVRKPIRWYGPSKRPRHTKRKSYGTMDSSFTSSTGRCSATGSRA